MLGLLLALSTGLLLVFIQSGTLFGFVTLLTADVAHVLARLPMSSTP